MLKSITLLHNTLKQLYNAENQHSIITCSYFPFSIKEEAIYKSTVCSDDMVKKITQHYNQNGYTTIKKYVTESYHNSIGKITITQSKHKFVYYVIKTSKLLNLPDGYAIITIFKEITSDGFPMLSSYDTIIRDQTLLQHKSHDIVFSKGKAGSTICVNFNVDNDINYTIKGVNSTIKSLLKFSQ